MRTPGMAGLCVYGIRRAATRTGLVAVADLFFINN
jgi:hypothetical protein